MVPVLSKVLSIPCAPCNLSIAVSPHLLRIYSDVVVGVVGVDKVEHFLIHLSNLRRTDDDLLPLSFRVIRNVLVD